jgi:GTPase SAR1 family protein
VSRDPAAKGLKTRLIEVGGQIFNPAPSPPKTPSPPSLSFPFYCMQTPALHLAGSGVKDVTPTMVFGQVVIGPPGSGKTTYCNGMRQFLEGLGRKVAVVNLDPANDVLPCAVEADNRDLISLEGAAAACELGPNGALVYCIEFLEANLDWLIDALERLKDCYVLIDMPGQVELYTHHYSVRNMLQKLTTNYNHRLTAVHLVDAHHCSDPAKFIAVLLVTLSTMVHSSCRDAFNCLSDLL